MIPSINNGCNFPEEGKMKNISNSEKEPVSIFAKQDTNKDGVITGEELVVKNRFTNIKFLPNEILEMVKDFIVKYNKNDLNSVKNAEAKVEEFITKKNNEMEKIAIKEFKEEIQESEEKGKAWIISEYQDADGNKISTWYDEKGNVDNPKED